MNLVQVFVCRCGLHDCTDYICCILLQISQGKCVAIDCLCRGNSVYNVIHILLTAGHLDVISGEDTACGCRDGINWMMIPLNKGLFLGCKPICHNDTLKSPFVPCHRLMPPRSRACLLRHALSCKCRRRGVGNVWGW